MPLQDLTPQLRTRLTRMERNVGWFVMIAVILLLAGLSYYLYNSAKAKGWFDIKARYFTYVRDGSGLAIGDSVTLMGFDVGRITAIEPMEPRSRESKMGHNVRVEFMVLRNNYSYLWAGDSAARFIDEGFLGKRRLDLTKGTNGYTTYLQYSIKQMPLDEIRTEMNNSDTNLFLGEEIYPQTNQLDTNAAAASTNQTVKPLQRAWQRFARTNMALLAALDDLKVHGVLVIDTTHKHKRLQAIWNVTNHCYEPWTQDSIYELPPDEPPSLSDRMQEMVAQVQSALPNILQLTNQIASTLSNANNLTSNLNVVAANIRPAITNLNIITTQLKNPEGSLGEWILPTNLNQKINLTLGTANGSLSNLDTNLITLNQTLDHLANITSNLNNQVQVNTNILTNISDLIVHTDQFVQGLKRFWLFKHLFNAPKTNFPPPMEKGATLLKTRGNSR